MYKKSVRTLITVQILLLSCVIDSFAYAAPILRFTGSMLKNSEQEALIYSEDQYLGKWHGTFIISPGANVAPEQMSKIASRLARAGWLVLSIRYPSFLGFQLAFNAPDLSYGLAKAFRNQGEGIKGISKKYFDPIEQFWNEKKPIAVLGYSMGGAILGHALSWKEKYFDQIFTYGTDDVSGKFGSNTDVEVYFIGGFGDDLINQVKMQKLAAEMDAERYTVFGANHFSIIDEPDLNNPVRELDGFAEFSNDRAIRHIGDLIVSKLSKLIPGSTPISHEFIADSDFAEFDRTIAGTLQYVELDEASMAEFAKVKHSFFERPEFFIFSKPEFGMSEDGSSFQADVKSSLIPIGGGFFDLAFKMKGLDMLQDLGSEFEGMESQGCQKLGEVYLDEFKKMLPTSWLELFEDQTLEFQVADPIVADKGPDYLLNETEMYYIQKRDNPTHFLKILPVEMKLGEGKGRTNYPYYCKFPSSKTLANALYGIIASEGLLD